MMRIILPLSICALVSPALSAAPLNYNIATDATVIGLSWNGLGDTPSQAKLAGVTGEVTLDPARDYNDSIRVKIPVTSLTASNSLLTYQLKSSLFFDAMRYPLIIFTSTRVVEKGEGRFRIFGLLQVKDVQRPVILEAALEDRGGTSAAENELALRATTTISRAAFHMDRLAVLVDDKITIRIDIQAQQVPRELAGGP